MAKIKSLLSILRRHSSGAGARNFGWLVGDRLLRFAIGIVVGSWAARYLGKDNFGALSYAQALAAIVFTVAPLGMEALTLREIIRQPAAAGHWIGSVIGFRAGSSVLGGMLIFLLAIRMRPDNTSIPLLVLCLAVGLLFQSLESGELLFQARSEMSQLVVPRMVIVLLMTGLKVLAIVSGKSVFWFAGLTALEQVMSGLVTLFYLRRRLVPSDPLRFSWAAGSELLRQSWPLAVAAAAVIVYVKIGQLMLGNLLGDAALGIYAAGARIPEALYFVPTVLGTSMLPALVRAQTSGGNAYGVAALRYMRVNVLAALVLVLPLAAGAWVVVRVLFGPSFAAAAPVMFIHAWSLLFVFAGAARGQLLLNERKVGYSLFFSLVGLAATVSLNAWLIPRYGSLGAALATVFSYAISGLVATFWLPATRPVGRLQVRALLSPWQVLKQSA